MSIIRTDTRSNLDNLDELHAKVDSLPKIMLDIYEDTVPRLFFIFPEDDGHWWNLSIDILFTKAFRLFFICEHEIVDKNGECLEHHPIFSRHVFFTPDFFVIRFRVT